MYPSRCLDAKQILSHFFKITKGVFLINKENALRVIDEIPNY